MKTCVICNKEMRTYLCDGCSQRFCLKHLDEHRKHLEKEFDQIETEHDEFRQMINEHKQDSTMHPIIEFINSISLCAPSGKKNHEEKDFHR